MVDQGDKRLTRPTSTPFASCHSNLYRRLKRRLGCSLRRFHSKRHLVCSRKPSSCKLPGTKSGLVGPKKVPAHSAGKGRSSCHGQHYSCGIHQQGRRYEVSSLCALLWRLLCWCNLNVVLKARHIPGRLNVLADKLDAI